RRAIHPTGTKETPPEGYLDERLHVLCRPRASMNPSPDRYEEGEVPAALCPGPSCGQPGNHLRNSRGLRQPTTIAVPIDRGTGAYFHDYELCVLAFDFRDDRGHLTVDRRSANLCRRPSNTDRHLQTRFEIVR